VGKELIELGQALTIELTYDDGGGNTGTYETIVASGTWDYHKISEAKFYRPKCLAVLPPKEDDTWDMALDTTTGGSPPATISVTIDTNGELSWAVTDSYITHVRFKYTIKIISIDHDAVFVVNDNTLTMILPQDNSNQGRMSLYNGSYLLGGATYALSINWDDQDYSHDHFNAVNDYYTFHLWYDMTAVEDDNKPNVTHNVLVTSDYDLLNTDWHTGKIIEQGLQLAIAATGLMDGKLGPAIGALMEYQQDGEFGDLDLPIEIMERRWSRT
jgi:hypothetical protein